jgi:hypothetical protein
MGQTVQKLDQLSVAEMKVADRGEKLLANIVRYLKAQLFGQMSTLQHSPDLRSSTSSSGADHTLSP